MPFDNTLWNEQGRELVAANQTLVRLHQEATQARKTASTQQGRWQQFASQSLYRAYNALVAAHQGPVMQLDEWCLRVVTWRREGDRIAPLEILEPEVDLVIPVPPDKILRWPWRCRQPLREVGVRLATYLRVNHCHLRLTLFDQDRPVASARLDGPDVRDNETAWFAFDHALPPGEYWAELSSPDARAPSPMLAVRVSPAIRDQGGSQTPHYRYRPGTDFVPRLAALSRRPEFLLFGEVGDERDLDWALSGLAAQAYPHWRLWLRATTPLPAALHAFQQRFPERIRFFSATTPWSSLLSQAEDRAYLARLDWRAQLTPDALLAYAEAAQTESPVMLYGDEDQPDPRREGFDQPWFKPDFSPDFLRARFYCGAQSWFLARHARARELWDRPAIDPEWAAALVLSLEHPGAGFHHLAQVLIHRRPAASLEPLIQANTLQAVPALGLRFSPETGTAHYPAPSPAPRVSIVIPNKDQPHLLHRCVQSLAQATVYPDWEIVVVDNGSQHPEIRAVHDHWQRELDARWQVIEAPGAFNFSALVNQGVAAATGDFLLVLNNDTELLGPAHWLERMVGHAAQPHVGCVGVGLRYADESVQHAGLALGVGGVANALHEFHPADDPGYQGMLRTPINVSAITGACCLVPRSRWESVGGFDEALAVAFNDVDFCLKLGQKGFYHVVLPEIQMYHYASLSRGGEDNTEKRARLARETQLVRQRWGEKLDRDPFYNPHFHRAHGDFELALDSPYYHDNILEMLDCR